MNTRSIAIAILWIAITTTAADAAAVRATAPDAALDRAVATALEAAPELTSARADVEAARRRITPAQTLPDPTASLTYDGDRRMAGLMVSQAIPWPGKLALAGRAAQSDATAVEAARVGRAALTIESRVRNAWYDLALARAIDKLLDERRATSANIAEVARQRYAAGLAVQQDVLRAQIETARVGEAKLQQQAAITSAVAELNRLLGKRQDAPLEAAPSIPADPTLPSAADLISSALERNAEIAAARQTVESSKIRIEAARKGLLPDFVVSAGPMAGSMTTTYQASVGVSIPLRAAKRQKNQIGEAEATEQARSADVETLTRDLEVRTRERIAALDAATRAAALYREQILPLDQLSFESALSSYQAGKVPFITVFQSLDSLYRDRATLAGREAEAARWRAAIDEASLGSSPVATPSAGSSASPSSSPSMTSM